MDPRHLFFIRRWGIDVYNSYFNRDKPIEIILPDEDSEDDENIE